MLKMLVAEDDMVSRKMMSKILNEYGECDLVVNGIEAIDAYLIALEENDPYDLVFLDIMMPKLDGIKALKTIRDFENQHKVKKAAKIIMLTALTETEVVDDSFSKGADAYATKPVDIDKLIDVMRKLELVK